MSKSINNFWDNVFTKSVCVFCGKGKVNKVYKDYASHNRCEKENDNYPPTEEQIKASNFSMKSTIHNGQIFNQLTK